MSTPLEVTLGIIYALSEKSNSARIYSKVSMQIWGSKLRLKQSEICTKTFKMIKASNLYELQETWGASPVS